MTANVIAAEGQNPAKCDPVLVWPDFRSNVLVATANRKANYNPSPLGPFYNIL